MVITLTFIHENNSRNQRKQFGKNEFDEICKRPFIHNSCLDTDTKTLVHDEQRIGKSCITIPRAVIMFLKE
jgi:hypothetical protein